MKRPKRTLESRKIRDLFDVKSGDIHAASELDPGNVPLISCGDTNNGLMGHYEIPDELQYKHCITVAYNGSWPLTAKFHPYSFGTKDDIAVLIPKQPMDDTTQLYIAALLNAQVWRYSYGRKCFRDKLKNVRLAIPVDSKSEGKPIDEQAIKEIFSKSYRDLIPAKSGDGVSVIPALKWCLFSILEIFDLQRGDFHSIANLDPGDFMTVSRTADNNGMVGYFDAPDGATVYEHGLLTVSTVGGEAFVQVENFIATDNVVICFPKLTLRMTTLFFIAFMLNYQRWRFGYGRQCYQAKLARVNIHLPVNSEGQIDEDSIESIVTKASYWKLVAKRLPFTVAPTEKQLKQMALFSD